MCDQDSKRVSHSEMVRQSPMQKEYTFKEAIDFIIDYNNWPKSTASKEHCDRLLREAIKEEKIKYKSGYRIHEGHEYNEFIGLNSKYLEHYIFLGDELKKYLIEIGLMDCKSEKVQTINDTEKVVYDDPKKARRILLSLKTVIEILYEFIEELFNDDVCSNYSPQQKKIILSQYNLFKELTGDSFSGIHESTLRTVISSQYWLINEIISSKPANKYNSLMPKNGKPLNVTKLSKKLPIRSEHQLTRDTVKKHINKCLSKNGT